MKKSLCADDDCPSLGVREGCDCLEQSRIVIESLFKLQDLRFD